MPNNQAQAKPQQHETAQIILPAHKNTPCISLCRGCSYFDFYLAASISFLQADSTLLKIGTQVDAP